MSARQKNTLSRIAKANRAVFLLSLLIDSGSKADIVEVRVVFLASCLAMLKLVGSAVLLGVCDWNHQSLRVCLSPASFLVTILLITRRRPMMLSDIYTSYMLVLHRLCSCMSALDRPHDLALLSFGHNLIAFISRHKKTITGLHQHLWMIINNMPCFLLYSLHHQAELEGGS